MGDAIGQMLASAVGIAISPLPIIAVILMLVTPHGRANGLAFTTGWLVSLALVVTVVLLIGSGAAASSGAPVGWTLWLKLALGLLFLALGAKQCHDRPRAGQPTSEPGWMQAIDQFTPTKSAGLAAALAVANPKNLVLAVGGAVSIAGTGATDGAQAVAAALLVLIGSLCVLLPLGVYLVGGPRSAHALADWKGWMAAHNTAIMTVLLLVLGAKYAGDALSGLTS
ncbi:GAP family protein [Krasilnikovia sp. MM14-A1259]|uniref:GAP family protein n=1 Tax=Krasilnikovia sp. MM14-A1259 TaxID=3373539 RepID=UPI003823F8AF